MQVQRLSLRDWRSFAELELTFGEGLTALVGANGQGKTNVLEAVGYLADLTSFRRATPEALIRAGADHAIVRGEVRRGDRDILIEAEIRPAGRSKVLVNRQRLARRRDLLGAVQVTVFSPDDLELVKGGPRGRRDLLDNALVGARPANDVPRAELDRVLRQRNALLKQSRGRLSDEVVTTLEVWDTKLTELGETWGSRRRDLVAQLAPYVATAYGQLSGSADAATLTYEPAWLGRLAAALEEAREDELRRGVSLVGPHRDELDLSIGGLPARSHGSQGEQRSLALALRLAVHLLLFDTYEEAPVLLLDDVFSELDPQRSDALVALLPAGQTLLTTAGALPESVHPERVLAIADGEVAPAEGR